MYAAVRACGAWHGAVGAAEPEADVVGPGEAVRRCAGACTQSICAS